MHVNLIVTRFRYPSINRTTSNVCHGARSATLRNSQLNGEQRHSFTVEFTYQTLESSRQGRFIFFLGYRQLQTSGLSTCHLRGAALEEHIAKGPRRKLGGQWYPQDTAHTLRREEIEVSCERRGRLMVCVWVPNLHKEMDQNDYCGETRSG